MKQNWRDIPSMTQQPPMKKIKIRYSVDNIQHHRTNNRQLQQPSVVRSVMAMYKCMIKVPCYRSNRIVHNNHNAPITSTVIIFSPRIWNMDQPHPPAPYLPQEMMVVSSRKICVNHPMSWRKVSISVPCAKVTIRMKRCYHFPLDMMDRL